MHRLCENTVPGSCLAVKSTEVCVDELIEQLLLSEHAAAARPTTGPHIAAIVAPVVATGVICRCAGNLAAYAPATAAGRIFA